MKNVNRPNLSLKGVILDEILKKNAATCYFSNATESHKY